jgi:hypothetical protein
MKKKAFVVPGSPDTAPLKELNTLLDKGWAVATIHQSTNGGWFVVAQESADSRPATQP